MHMGCTSTSDLHSRSHSVQYEMCLAPQYDVDGMYLGLLGPHIAPKQLPIQPICHFPSGSQHECIAARQPASLPACIYSCTSAHLLLHSRPCAHSLHAPPSSTHQLGQHSNTSCDPLPSFSTHLHCPHYHGCHHRTHRYHQQHADPCSLRSSLEQQAAACRLPCRLHLLGHSGLVRCLGGLQVQQQPVKKCMHVSPPCHSHSMANFSQSHVLAETGISKWRTVIGKASCRLAKGSLGRQLIID